MMSVFVGVSMSVLLNCSGIEGALKITVVTKMSFYLGFFARSVTKDVFVFVHCTHHRVCLAKLLNKCVELNHADTPCGYPDSFNGFKWKYCRGSTFLSQGNSRFNFLEH